MTQGENVLDAPFKPASVWDARDADWPNVLLQSGRAAWLTAHGLNAGQIFRAEFYLIDAPFVRVFTYARDEEGRVLIVPGPQPHWRAADPEDVPLPELPPEELL
jgi:hypothetical protein